MNAMTWEVQVISRDPLTLYDRDWREFGSAIHQTFGSRSGIGEFVACYSCRSVYATEDIIPDDMPMDAYRGMVDRIIRGNSATIPCPCCEESTHYMWWGEKIEQIRRKLCTRTSAFITCHAGGHTVGWMEGIVAPLEDIYDDELSDHYRNVPVSVIRERIDRTLGYISDDFVSLSSIGLVKGHDSFFTIFQVLSAFFRAIPDEHLITPGLAELNRRSNLHAINRIMGATPIAPRDDHELYGNISQVGSGYESDIVAYHNPTERFREQFSIGFKSFLRKYGGALRAKSMPDVPVYVPPQTKPDRVISI